MPGLTFVSFCLKRNGFASFAFKRRKEISFTDRCKQFYDLSSNSRPNLKDQNQPGGNDS